MIHSLYDVFKHWSKRGSVYIISDPHFKDADCELMNANWLDPDEHLANINKIVHKNDTLICLGDCGDLSYISRIKAGYKVLIKGNHDDKGNSVYKRQQLTETYRLYDYTKESLYELLNKKYPNSKIYVKDSIIDQVWNVNIDNHLFDEVYNGPLFIADRILLSHEPINGLSFCLNIHGHVHNGIPFYIDKFNGQHFNIASDVVNWTVINLGQLMKGGILHNIHTIHRLTINKAIENKKGESYE